jgi:hypothetical protein
MFETINYLLYDKSKKELDYDLLEEFNSYITRKTFSYYDNGKYCNYINDTINSYGDIFITKEDQFNFYNSIIPKLKRKRFEYIKKTPKKDEQEFKVVPEFLSKREVEFYNSTLTKLN